jgi:DMSO/TMAO reductase YedYZ molybdopterin-dependent catalytic subunit
VWLGVCFVVAFLTGLYSHYAQLAHPPLGVLTGPSWLYRVTQGVHVASGTAAVPLLLVKLWSVYPRLFVRPPTGTRARVVDVVERGSVALLVSSAIFQLSTGLANAAQWYPWGFAFRPTHYAVGWVAMGSVLLHVAVRLPRIREGLSTPIRPAARGEGALSRRAVLGATWASVVLAVVATAASGVPGLRHLSVLATRTGDGPQGVPVNKSARAAGVVAAATDPGYRLVVASGRREVRLTRAELEALPQTTVTLPIACVEGWSASGTWTGVRLRDLVALVTSGPAAVRVESLQRSGGSRSSRVEPALVDHDETVLALRLGEEPLDLDHGYPCRLIAPNRPGTLQTKWVARLEVES